MAAIDKLKALGVSSTKQLPVVNVLIDAIQSERSRLKLENLEEVLNDVVKNIDRLNLDVNVSSDNETSSLINDIFKEVENDFEELKKACYSNLLTNIISSKNKNIDNQKAFSEVLYQLKNMTGRDVENFTKMYIHKLFIIEEYKNTDIISAFKSNNKNFSDQDIKKIKEKHGIDVSNMEIAGPMHINEEDFSRVTVQKFISLGLLNVPRNVSGHNVSPSFYKPSLTVEADSFYKHCLTISE